MNIKFRSTCRICGNPHLADVIDLGEQFLQGAFVKEGYTKPSFRKVPNKIVRCDTSKSESACGLVQTKHTVPPEIMYANYWYQSGVSYTMKAHLESIVNRALSFKKNPKEILDIACNDGTLFNYYPKNIIKYGIDPSNVTGRVKDNDAKIINELFPSEKLKSLGNKFDIITSIAMFYDLDDPKTFVENISLHLQPNGIWCFEMAYLPYILENLCYDTIVSEHLEHYHLAPIEYLLNRCGLKLFDIYKNDINGGSIQCWATHSDCFEFDSEEGKQRISSVRAKEFDLALDDDKPYEIFRQKVSIQRYELTKLLDNIRSEGKRIHLYGASTKANTLLGYCGIDTNYIEYAAERSKEKWGAKTISGIKIISEEESRKLRPDYYLVGPWHFREEILQREKDIINSGIKFIFPLPSVTIIDKV